MVHSTLALCARRFNGSQVRWLRKQRAAAEAREMYELHMRPERRVSRHFDFESYARSLMIAQRRDAELHSSPVTDTNPLVDT